MWRCRPRARRHAFLTSDRSKPCGCSRDTLAVQSLFVNCLIPESPSLLKRGRWGERQRERSERGRGRERTFICTLSLSLCSESGALFKWTVCSPRPTVEVSNHASAGMRAWLRSPALACSSESLRWDASRVLAAGACSGASSQQRQPRGRRNATSQRPRPGWGWDREPGIPSPGDTMRAPDLGTDLRMLLSASLGCA